MCVTFFRRIKILIITIAVFITLNAVANAKTELFQICNDNVKPLSGKIEEKEKGPLQAAVEIYKKTRKFHNSLAENGVIIELGYRNDLGFNLGGALQSRTAVKSISLLDMSLNLDTERMGLWKGGNFFLLGQNIHGKSLTSNRTGDFQYLSNIDAPNRIQLSEFGFEQSLFDDRLIAIIGKQDANNLFGALDLAGEFVQSSFGLIPNASIPTYPDQALGIAAVVNPLEWLNFKAGIYDGDSRGKELGFRTTFDSQGGFITLAETGITPELAGHSGNYFVGFWSHSADIDEIYSETPARYSNSYGFYASMEQEVFREGETDEGLDILGQFGWAPSDRNEIARYYGAGFTYRGLFPYRNRDIAGVGMAMADISNRFIDAESVNNETALEFFYKFRVNDSLVLQPDIQVIFNAGGSNKTAMAIGIRTIFTIVPQIPEML